MIAFIPAFIHIVQYTQFSPIDELRHLDYALQITSGHVPEIGDKLGQDAMREEACRGIDLPFRSPRCDSATFDPIAFRDDGWQTAAPHPPVYYILSGISGRTLSDRLSTPFNTGKSHVNHSLSSRSLAVGSHTTSGLCNRRRIWPNHLWQVVAIIHDFR